MGQDLSLHIGQKRFTTGLHGKFDDVVGTEVVEEASPIGARQFDERPVAEIDESRAGGQRLVFESGVGDPRST